VREEKVSEAVAGAVYREKGEVCEGMVGGCERAVEERRRSAGDEVYICGAGAPSTCLSEGARCSSEVVKEVLI
jgi:hypothetical protein